ASARAKMESADVVISATRRADSQTLRLLSRCPADPRRHGCPAINGYGYSDRYPEMSAPAADNPPLCDAQDASEQVEAVVRFILERCKASNLSLISSPIGSHRLIQRVGEAANMPFSIQPHIPRHACRFS